MYRIKYRIDVLPIFLYFFPNSSNLRTHFTYLPWSNGCYKNATYIACSQSVCKKTKVLFHSLKIMFKICWYRLVFALCLNTVVQLFLGKTCITVMVLVGLCELTWLQAATNGLEETDHHDHWITALCTKQLWHVWH